MSGPIEGDLEAFIDGKVEFKPLTPADRAKIRDGLGALASAEAIGISAVPMPDLMRRNPKDAA